MHFSYIYLGWVIYNWKIRLGKCHFCWSVWERFLVAPKNPAMVISHTPPLCLDSICPIIHRSITCAVPPTIRSCQCLCAGVLAYEMHELEVSTRQMFRYNVVRQITKSVWCWNQKRMKWPKGNLHCKQHYPSVFMAQQQQHFFSFTFDVGKLDFDTLIFYSFFWRKTWFCNVTWHVRC